MKCPRCGASSESTNKKWKYASFEVKQYYCEKCDKKFNAYYRENRLSHTIPKQKQK
jgi:transposase-like protein